jgi:hypothetical protein
MALCLSPCESFSPSMLRSEPAALAPWIRFRLAKWLLGAKVTASDWTSVHGDQTKIEVGTDTGTIDLARTAKAPMQLHYKLGPEMALEIGAPVPYAMRRLLRPPRDTDRVYLVGDNYNDEQHGDTLGVTRSFLAIDLYRLLDLPPTDLGNGAAGGVLLFGVKPELRANLARLASYSRRMASLTDEQLPRLTTNVPGLRSEWASPTRTGQVGADARAIHEELELIFATYPFRSMVFVGSLMGAINDKAVGYFGEIDNPTEDGATNTYRAPIMDKIRGLVSPIKKVLSFALGEVGKSKAEIEKDVTGQAKELLDAKITDPNLKKVTDFALGEVGKSPADIKKDLLKNVAGEVKGKLDAVVTNPLAKKVVDFGLDHATETGKELKASALGELKDEAKGLATQFWTDHKDQLMQYKYEAAAVAAIAIAENKQVRDFAVSQVKANLPDIAKTVFNAAGDKLHLPAGATDFLKNNASAIVSGDWQSLAKSAISTELGGGGFGNQAAAVVLEKLTGQPVTSQALKILGAQGLKALLDKGPVVAAGKAGEAAVTGATDTAVQVKTATGAAQLSHSDFAASYDTVASPGLV